jgi:hypothetical protein
MVLMLIFSREKLVECSLSVPHVTLPCGKYCLWSTFLSISAYLNKHYACDSSWLVAKIQSAWMFTDSIYIKLTELEFATQKLRHIFSFPPSIVVISAILNPFWFTNQ